jgi:hypothetical protein
VEKTQQKKKAEKLFLHVFNFHFFIIIHSATAAAVAGKKNAILVLCMCGCDLNKNEKSMLCESVNEKEIYTLLHSVFHENILKFFPNAAILSMRELFLCIIIELVYFFTKTILKNFHSIFVVVFSLV